jgi:hypothetical protein
MKKKKPTLKRIKESVTEQEYKKLMSAIRGGHYDPTPKIIYFVLLQFYTSQV